jgi:hypothetical protein
MLLEVGKTTSPGDQNDSPVKSRLESPDSFVDNGSLKKTVLVNFLGKKPR